MRCFWAALPCSQHPERRVGSVPPGDAEAAGGERRGPSAAPSLAEMDPEVGRIATFRITETREDGFELGVRSSQAKEKMKKVNLIGPLTLVKKILPHYLASVGL
ncbi:uncharacterized protein [Ovis canadensis]|uniref:uncharacterized protein isoform X1 n=1 Tax=Ovis canadensis TaxID=37174 RepID=UPI003750FA5E